MAEIAISRAASTTRHNEEIGALDFIKVPPTPDPGAALKFKPTFMTSASNIVLLSAFRQSCGSFARATAALAASFRLYTLSWNLHWNRRLSKRQWSSTATWTHFVFGRLVLARGVARLAHSCARVGCSASPPRTCCSRFLVVMTWYSRATRSTSLNGSV